jgi:protein SCO1/2
MKPEPEIGGIAVSCKRHEHESRARAPGCVLLVLQLILFIIAAGTSRSHDQSAAQQLKGAERREVRIPIGDFTLVDQGARSFNFKSLRGRVVIVAFVYTSCPDLCPLLTAAMRQVQDGVKGDERRQIYLMTITTDPEIDTPEVMAAYAKRYGVDLANWTFLSGSETALEKVWQKFGVGVKRKARGLVDHTPLTAVIDRTGTMRIAYVGAAPSAGSILQDVRKLFREHGRSQD